MFALGDLTAQAYEGAAVSTIDWARTARSGAVGGIQGPLGHAVFSSDGCLIDRLVEQQVSMLLRQNPSGVAPGAASRCGIASSDTALAAEAVV